MFDMMLALVVGIISTTSYYKKVSFWSSVNRSLLYEFGRLATFCEMLLTSPVSFMCLGSSSPNKKAVIAFDVLYTERYGFAMFGLST